MKLLLGVFLLFSGIVWATDEYSVADQFFTDGQYSLIMSYIKTVSKTVYDTLVQCELDLKRACIQKVTNISDQGLLFPTGDNHGYAILKLPIMHGWLVEGVQSNINGLVGLYAEFLLVYGNRMPLVGCEYILNLIKRLDINLYNHFLLNDTTGENHIRLFDMSGNMAAVSFHPQDGLPLFLIDSSLAELSLGEQLFVFGH